MSQDNQNFLLAAVLCMLVLGLWQFFIGGPMMEAERQRELARQQAQTQAEEGIGAPQPGTDAEAGGGVAVGGGGLALQLSRDQALAEDARVPLASPRLAGSISLKGGRLDDLRLVDYRETIEPDSPEITLLSPAAAPHPYYIDFGWTGAGAEGPALPGPDAQWTLAEGEVLSPETPVTLEWANGDGLTFRREFALDDQYLFTVTQSVANATDAGVALFPYALVQRRGTPETTGFYILHEGLIGVIEDTLEEVGYGDIQEDGAWSKETTGGWLGITDKYWMTALIPDQEATFTGAFKHTLRQGRDIYQADALGAAVTVPAGGEAAASSRVFAGAKVVDVIEHYNDTLAITRFDLAIDWGMLYFLTKPIFYVIQFFNNLVGNFGVAIILLVIVIKLIFFPLANKSYVAMSKMKKLQPDMIKIRERYEDDKVKQQQEMMALYKKEKVNPMAGCFPILLQIPVFFALYKVLFVALEMRHAPFFGWIRDLSAPDPTSWMNLFGALPYDIPAWLGPLSIGVWPILMGASMYIQQKLNPAPADPVQQRIFALMPIFFMFLLGAFAAGLVIYWTVNNVLSIIQQAVIMKRMGVPVRWGAKSETPAPAASGDGDKSS